MFEFLQIFEDAYPLLAYFIVLCFGLVVGSFLNVVILRVPVMLQRDWEDQANEILDHPVKERKTFNLILPNSHCPGCETEIKPWQNIPIFSYALLRGRCGNCGMKISLRYPVIEALTGVATVIVIAAVGLSPAGLSACLLTYALIALSMIDYDTQLLPDSITLPFLWLGLVLNYWDSLAGFEDAFVGACVGYLSLWLVYWAFKLLTGKEGMGYGDFKLLSMLGAWLGWQMLPLIIILSSFTGAILGGVMIAMGRSKDKPIPFGPYLAIAGWIALIWGDAIVSNYLLFLNHG